MKEVVKITEDWAKLTNKEITDIWNLEGDILEGMKAGYVEENLKYKVYKGEVYMKVKDYNKKFKKSTKNVRNTKK